MPVIRLPTLGAAPDAPFPPVETALRNPNGLLAQGGDLSARRLLNAYRSGVFPWFAEGQTPLWWSPDPRMLFLTDAIHLSRRFRRSLRQCDWKVRADSAFDAVLLACAHSPRRGQRGTWITAGMIDAYRRLYQLGYAHSVEVFADQGLVGGIYGVAIGRMFFGESMFSTISGGSKVALAMLARRLHDWGWPLIDAQVENPHLLTLGARAWPRAKFIAQVERLTVLDGMTGYWHRHFGESAASELAA